MSLDVAAGVRKTVGAKQTLKAMKRNEVTHLYIAKDCDEQVVAPLVEASEGAHIPVDARIPCRAGSGLPYQSKGCGRRLVEITFGNIIL